MYIFIAACALSLEECALAIIGRTQARAGPLPARWAPVTIPVAQAMVSFDQLQGSRGVKRPSLCDPGTIPVACCVTGLLLGTGGTFAQPSGRRGGVANQNQDTARTYQTDAQAVHEAVTRDLKSSTSHFHRFNLMFVDFAFWGTPGPKSFFSQGGFNRELKAALRDSDGQSHPPSHGFSKRRTSRCPAFQGRLRAGAALQRADSKPHLHHHAPRSGTGNSANPHPWPLQHLRWPYICAVFMIPVACPDLSATHACTS